MKVPAGMLSQSDVARVLNLTPAGVATLSRRGILTRSRRGHYVVYNAG